MLKNNIAKIRKSIIAIGFKPKKDQVTMLGSGFSIDDQGRILSVAHIYNQLEPNQKTNLMGMAMTKQEKNGLEYYAWLPLKLIKKNDKDDLALFKLDGHERTILGNLYLGDSDTVEVGDEAYFMGFPYAAQLINEGFGITLIINKTIISNIKRDGIDPEHYRNWFIIDAISNPGNSGCPLIDHKTNKVTGIMSITFRTPSKVQPDLDIREPMHIAGAKPINLAKNLLK